MKRSLLTAFCIVLFAGAFAQPGVLDQAFGVGGKVVTTSPVINSHSIEGNGIALQQDGKIIVVGGALSPTDSSSFVVFRYNVDGILDNSFGLNGVVTTSVNLYGKSGAGAVAVQLDGKIVVGGYAVYDSAGSYNTALTRYNNDGTLDSSFGLNGIVNDIINPTWYEGNSINRIIILPNGKILAGGKNTLSIVYQYNSQGQLDMVYSTPFTSNAVNAILVQSDGKVLGGCSRGLGINRFKTTGSSDSSFGNYTGQSFLNLNYDSSYGYNACLQQNGKIILAGEAWLGGKSYIVMGRLTTDGVVDSSFGNNGNVITSVGNANDRATNLIQLTNGNLLVTGSTSFNNGTPGNSDFVLLQYNKDGLLDSSFGIHGKIITDFDGSEDNAISSTVQLDGKIIVLGRTFQNGIWKIAMARYERNSISNYNTIVGNVFFDKNSNAIKDPNETYYNMAKIEVVKPNFDTIGISSYNGIFSVEVDTGFYSTKIIPLLNYYSAIPINKTTIHNSYFNTDTITIAVQAMNGQRDASLEAFPLNTARSGFELQYQLLFRNQGTDTITNGTVQLIKSNKLNFDSASLVPTSVIGDTMRWNISSLKPLETGNIQLYFTVKTPPVVNIGDTLQSTATLTSNKPDLTPADNYSTVKQIVRGSFDPNDKTENHGGKITTLQVANGDYLQYTIRFQNTGNDTAFNVYIRDTLDNKLDWSTMQILTASHSYQMTMNDGNKCLFTLRNINLVDSTTNEPSSHGYIVYKVKPKSTVALGDIIKNTAAIYFDYNLPVLTNTETTTVVNEVLPLRLLSFTAKKENKTNLLNWTTTNEISVDHFEIERSINGREFSKIGIVSSELSSGSIHKYSYTDNSPLTAHHSLFYRLKMLDKDGKFEYSPIRMINNNADGQISIYPNPARDMVTVTHLSTNSIALLLLTDITGRILRRTTVVTEAVQTNMNIRGLPAGKYNLTWSNGLINHTQALVID